MHQAPMTPFDVLVVGGGITGAGIALDAVTRGLRVLLLEKHDFAFGTSSRSTKLIHGGLRYLKQLEFGLVKEVGSERAVVHSLAPHLVVPEKMLLPLYERKGMGYWLASLGLKIYDWLAGVQPKDQRKMLTRPQTLRHEPLLKPDDVKGGALYAEYRTDDARLTIEIVKTACANGAKAINYCRVTDFLYHNGTITGVIAKDELTNELLEIKAQVVVNAAGPWVDDLREVNRSKKGKRLHLTKGVHLVVARERFNIAQAIYFDVGDGRMIFAIPRDQTTYIGTTDTNYVGDKENVYTDLADAEYILNAVNTTFPTVELTLGDVQSSWAGLRPLIHEDGKSASELSRKDEIFVSDSGLISIAGGKLTGYRKMAERIVDKVLGEKFPHNHSACKTAVLPLTGYHFKNDEEVRQYSVKLKMQLQVLGLEHYHRYLVHNYGQQTDLILERLKMNLEKDVDLALAKAEYWFCVNFEMAVEPFDFFIRRTGMLYFHRHRMEQIWPPILEEFRKHFSWTPEKTSDQQKLILQSIEKAYKFGGTD
ncbi:MAG: glycerol-3-phosphate dehydrogenase/oxidase [Flammeovirgaceae bacterium]